MGALSARSGDLFRKGDYDGWSYNEVVGDGDTSEPIKIKPAGRGTSLGVAQIRAGAGTGRVETTLDTPAEIDADTADWDAWDEGNVTGTTTGIFKVLITGIRCVSVSGAITFKLIL